MRRGYRGVGLEVGPLSFTRYRPVGPGWIATIFAVTFWLTANLLRLAWWAVIAAVAGSLALGALVIGAVTAWRERS